MTQPSNTLEQIIENIHAGDDSTRNKAFEDIIECGSEAIVPLISLLDHPDEQIRDSAVWALCQMNNVAGPILIQELSNKNPLIRESASFCLGICKNTNASQALLLLLKDENEKVRETAAWSLVKIGVDDENTVKQIIACLDDESILVKETAQWILEHIGESAFEPLFQKLMESSSDNERIINILSRISPDKIDALLQLLETTQDIQKLSYLIQLIGQLRDPQSIECLLPFLNHNSRHIITHTVEALINIGELTIEPLFEKLEQGSISPTNEMMPLFIRHKSASVPQLIAMLQSSNNSLRIFAARALGVIEDRRAIEPCITGLKDSNIYFVEACARALSAFTNKLIIKPLTDCIMDSNYPIVKSNAIDALAGVLDSKAALQLLQKFTEASLTVKKRLLQLASYYPSSEAEELLQQALLIDDDECKMIALQGLRKIGTEKSIECVRDAIIKENPYISDEARSALKEIIERKQREVK